MITDAYGFLLKFLLLYTLYIKLQIMSNNFLTELGSSIFQSFPQILAQVCTGCQGVSR